MHQLHQMCQVILPVQYENSQGEKITIFGERRWKLILIRVMWFDLFSKKLLQKKKQVSRGKEVWHFSNPPGNWCFNFLEKLLMQKLQNRHEIFCWKNTKELIEFRKIICWCWLGNLTWSPWKNQSPLNHIFPNWLT